MANSAMHRAREQLEFNDRIIIGSHSGLECNPRQRSELFTNDGTNWNSRRNKIGNYDGLHMYSQFGARMLTPVY